jgi:regulator of sigma E protease
MNILILLSLLAIFNLLPIPPLDGGHILFIIVEKNPPQAFDAGGGERIYTVAFMVMLAVFVLITALDIFFPVNLTP